MNKEQLKQNIEKMEAELAKMKVELEKSEKAELEGGSLVIYSDGSIDLAITTPSIVNGATRAGKELAEIASKNMVARNKLEAYAMQLEPEWRDVVGITCYYIFKYGDKFFIGSSSDYRYIGAVHMSKSTAETLCQWLNEGRITLEKE